MRGGEGGEVFVRSKSEREGDLSRGEMRRGRGGGEEKGDKVGGEVTVR